MPKMCSCTHRRGTSGAVNSGEHHIVGFGGSLGKLPVGLAGHKRKRPEHGISSLRLPRYLCVFVKVEWNGARPCGSIHRKTKSKEVYKTNREKKQHYKTELSCSYTTRGHRATDRSNKNGKRFILCIVQRAKPRLMNKTKRTTFSCMHTLCNVYLCIVFATCTNHALRRVLIMHFVACTLCKCTAWLA